MENLSNRFKRVLVTGGAGFIGGSLVRRLLQKSTVKVFNLDKLSYASDLTGISDLIKNMDLNENLRYKFLNIDLLDKDSLEKAFEIAKPDLIIHMAAESHVDRSIDNPKIFIESNIMGTFNLLELSRNFFYKLSDEKKSIFKFVHISTDEVFGTLGSKGSFSEFSNYDPRSPYSASKASSDHLVNSWFHTYGLPVITTNCSNNFGPWQFPEKLIPLVIIKALKEEKIPLYGDGLNIRDWLFIEDHIDALILVINKGKNGDKYCIGGQGEKTNKELVELICMKLNKLINNNKDFLELIYFVRDRPGHDKRYSIDPKKLIKELNWKPRFKFELALEKTIIWYIENQKWCDSVKLKSNYFGERIG